MRITKVAYLGRTTLGEETVIKTRTTPTGRELAPDAGGARLRALELVAPGDDVGASDGYVAGRIVDAIPGHSDDLAVCLKRQYYAQLLLRHDPREHSCGTYAQSQVCIAQLLKLFACNEVFGVEAR